MSKFTSFIFILMLLLLSATGISQEEFVVKIKGPNVTGSGVIVYKKDKKILIASALHVFRDNMDGPIILSKVFSAITSEGKCINGLQYAASDEGADTILMWGETEIDTPVATIGDNSIITGIDVNYNTNNLKADFIGYGYGVRQKISGKVCFKDKKGITSDGICIPGQSGGGMFIANELYGIILGGHHWYNETDMKISWPIVCADASILKQMIKDAVADPPRDGPD